MSIEIHALAPDLVCQQGADAVTRGRGILEFRLPGELASS